MSKTYIYIYVYFFMINPHYTEAFAAARRHSQSDRQTGRSATKPQPQRTNQPRLRAPDRPQHDKTPQRAPQRSESPQS